MLFVNSVYSHSTVFTGTHELELIIISVRLQFSSLTIALFYRPPGTPPAVLDDLLTVLCTNVSPVLLSSFILLEDFNVNYFDTSHHLFSKLLFVTNSLALTQVVSDATYYSTNSNSLIDLVFLSSPTDLLLCETIPPLSNSDHLGLHFKISIPKSKRHSTKCERKVWRYAYTDFNRANEMIADTDWETLLSSSNINECWSTWRDQFLQIMDTCIPKVILKGRKNLPWLTKPVIKAMRQRNRTFHAAKRSKSLADWEKYKIVRNKVTAMLRHNKRQYFYKLRFSSQKDFWKAVKIIKK